MFIFIKERQYVRDPDEMKGRKMVQANFAILAGIYPDFYGWRYHYFVLFLWLIHPGLNSYYIVAYIISFYQAVLYMDIELLGPALCFGTVVIMYCIVSIHLIARKSDLDHLMQMVGRGLHSNYSRKTEEEISFIEKAVGTTRKYSRLSTLFLLSAIVAHMGILPIIRGSRGLYTSITNETAPINKYSPLPIWTPYECNSLTTFIISYITQIIPGVMKGMILNACCILYVGLSQQIAGNLRVLTTSLRDLPARALHMFVNEGGIAENVTNDLYKDKHFLKCLNACLAENISHHMAIIEFYNKLQSLLGFSIFATFSGTALIISTAAYSLIVIADRGGDTEVFLTNVFAWVMYLVLYVNVLSVYCYFGQQVTNQSEEVLRALYDTPWLEGDVSFRRSIIITMSYAQEPMSMSALGLANASNETLLDIISTSFSYLNMLLVSRDSGD